MKMAETNPNLILETAVLRRRNKDTGLGTYFILARTHEGKVFEYEKSCEVIGKAIMWSEMLEGTVLVTKDWWPGIPFSG